MSDSHARVAVPIGRIDVSAYRVPTDFPEADGTITWDSTTIVIVEATAGMDIASGEYGYDLPYFQHMLDAGAVDVVQADATRCLGITGFMRVAALAEARFLPFSSHCAPTLHIAPCCAVGPVPVMEYFHDHVRIEHMLFNGVPLPVKGVLHPDLSRPGLGLELKRAAAEQYCVMRKA